MTAWSEQTQEEIMFKVLGPLEVSSARGPVHIPKSRQHAILCTLLIDANRVVTTEALIDAAWGDDPPSTARSQVHICVSRLRRKFLGLGLNVPLLTRPTGYAVEVADEALDLLMFRDTVARAESTLRAGRAGESAILFRSALSLWRGPAVGGICESLRHRAARLDEWRLSVQESCFEIELALGRHHGLVAELGEFVAEHPLRDRPRGQLMLALYRCGRTPEALEAYRAGRTLLADQFGLEPSEDLQRMELAILAQDPALRYSQAPYQGDSDGADRPSPRARAELRGPAAKSRVAGLPLVPFNGAVPSARTPIGSRFPDPGGGFVDVDPTEHQLASTVDHQLFRAAGHDSSAIEATTGRRP
jgi:DNA-binding SARP family transcriptional activator